MKREIEVRQSTLNLSGESGEFEGYIAVWDTVDSYNSEFVRGSFKKTISERASKVKVLYNHDRLIGKAVELREDDHGVFAKGRVNLDLEIGRDVYALMKGGDLDGLSFAFQVFADEYGANGLRSIKEVRLLEFGPVDFPANDHALITGVRAEKIEEVCLRSSDFDKTYSDLFGSMNNGMLIDALYWTTWDIMADDSIEEKTDAILAAVSAFGAKWAAHVVSERDRLEVEAAKQIRSAGGPEKISRTTQLTEDDVIRAASGRSIVSNIEILGDSVVALQHGVRQSAVDSLLAIIDHLSDSDLRKIRKAVGADPSRLKLSDIWNTNL